MHPRNPYKVPPDFSSLAQAYPPLQQFLIHAKTLPQSLGTKSASPRTTIDFKDGKALRALTQAIMFHDFGIQLQIPENRLCPPVPNRMNYVLWIQDIMKISEAFSIETTATTVRGIDIGTGATVIYPFLVCHLNEVWEMIGTEIDDISYECALRNVEINSFQRRITIKKAHKKGVILFPLEDEAGSYNFTMCNPPFYSSLQEMHDLSEEKADAPNAVCSGSEIEMIYPNGGEVGFVARMVEESIRFQVRCKWYTSMLGRMSSVIEIIQLFRKRSISNYAITEFVQGRTRRWAVGWSFSEIRLPDSLSRITLHPSHSLASYMPLHTTLRQPLRLSITKSYKYVVSRLIDVMKGIEGIHVAEHKNDTHSSSLRMEAKENTWSRSARRKRKRRDSKEGKDVEEDIGRTGDRQSSTPRLVCDVRIILSRCLENASWNEAAVSEVLLQSKKSAVDDEWTGLEVGDELENGKPETGHLKLQEDPGYILECQWIFGTDHGVFETFVGHVGRKLIESIHTG